jgi:hypothetical protein
MEKPTSLRRKAARFFEDAATSPTTHEAEKLKEVGCQLELWADELEEIETGTNRKSPKLGNDAA